MLRFFVLALGGTVGTFLRYIISESEHAFARGALPVTTLLVNLTGSFLIGLAWGIGERLTLSPNIRLFIFMGVLGGFTTFSTFTLENFNLIQSGAWRTMLFNVLVSNICGIILVYIGFGVARIITTFLRISV